MRRLRKNNTVRAWCSALFGLAGLLLAAGVASAQPLNDDFENAADLGNVPAGIILTNNFAGSRQANEPLISGNPGGSSVWFKWTAPADGVVTFNTFNSEINTLLAVYTGDALDNLVLIGQNDDYGAIAQSSVTFNAVSGTEYMISVDGYDQPPVDQGNITLNWGTGGGGPGSLSGGDFKFTTPYYVIGQNESKGALAGGDVGRRTTQARLTVTRMSGSRGRVFADYYITNALYTNQTFALVSTTNINTVATDTNGSVLGFTNTLMLAGYTLDLKQNNIYGLFVDGAIFNLSEVFIAVTNFNNQFTNSTFVITNIFTNIINVSCLPVMTNSITTNGNEIDITDMSITCDFTNFTWTSPAAEVGFDYLAQSGRLIFDDYQMSKDIFVQMPVPAQGADYIHHSSLPGFAPQAANRVLIGVITNVQFDPLESTNILAAPTAGTVFTNALVNILDQCVVPFLSWEGTNVFNFERATLRCSENVGTARVGVTRVTWDYKATTCPYIIDHNFINGRDNDWNVFRQARGGQNPGEGGPGIDDIELQAGSDYAIPTGNTHFGDPADFISVEGELSWPNNDPRPKFISVPVSNDTLVEFNEDLLLQIYFPPPAPQITEKNIGWLDTCILTIMFDDQPAGAVDRDHLKDNSDDTSPPYNLVPGANNTVYALAVQPTDGKTIIGGDFTAFNAFPMNRLARLNDDGSRDLSFNPGDGADAVVTTMLLDASGKILVGGYFTSMNRIARHGVARLNQDGSLDTTFQVGLGVDVAVQTLAVQTNGNVLIAGEFSSYNSQPRTRIARLFPNGQLDPTFDAGAGPDGTVWSMAVQPDGKIIIAGSFGSVAGFPCGHIARLNTDGSVDTSFDPGIGTDGVIYSIALQPDGKIVAAGGFGSVQGQSRNAIVRFDTIGFLDPAFDPGNGFDDTAYTVILQPDNSILVGGIFTAYNGTRRLGIARIYPDGVLDTTFMDSAYNQFAGLPSSYFNQDIEPHHFVYTLGLQPADGKVMIGGGFHRVGGGGTRDDVRSRYNVARLIGGATPGPGNIQFAQSFYSADQNTTNAFISLIRTNGNLGLASANISAIALPPGPGDAIDGVDYNFDAGTYGKPTWISTWSGANNGFSWQLADGTHGKNQGTSATVDPNTGFAFINNDVYIRILDSTNTGNRNLNLALTQPIGDDLTILGGENIAVGVALATRSAPMTIVDNHTLPGALGFSAASYRVNESTNAVISVTRTNGSGGLVTVRYSTTNGTAIAGTHYKASSGILTFPPGVTNQTFVVTNIDEGIINQDHTIGLYLYNPGGTPPATLGLTNATIIVTDNDFTGGYAQFDSTSYPTNENAGYALVTVGRYGGSANSLSVTFTATNGTAVNGTNYIGVSTNLSWSSGDVSPRIIPIKLLDDGIVNASNLTISNRLFNPTNNGVFRPQALGGNSNSVVVITNSDFRGTLAFSTTSYSVNENGGPGIVTVVRTGGSSESISVNFAAIPATATESDFTPTNGVLTFAPGELAKSFTVPITDNFLVDPPRFIALLLSNGVPTNVLGSPVAAILNIVDDESFNLPPGNPDTSVDNNLGFNNDIRSIALQPDGKVLVGGSFTNANGFSRRRMARLNSDLSLDTHFSSTSPTAGADNSVFTIVAQTDQRILIGGLFTSFNSVNRNYLARLSLDGSIDTTFNPGSGPNGAVNAALETFTSGGTDRKLLVGGAFTLMNATPRNYIARLNNNGSVDPNFDPGLGGDAPVFAMALQPDGKLLVGGDFTTFNGVAHNHIVRLNVDGSIDVSFNVGSGTDASVRAIAVQSDGRIVIGGLFTNVNGSAFNRLARLNINGSVDNTFNVAPGMNDVVNSLAIQPDNRILVGGQFTLANGVTRGRITRLKSDGTADPMINFGLGCNGFVSSVILQTNGMILFGGGFTTYDSQPHQRLARVYGGTVGGSGSFEFDSANYVVPENGTNVLLTIRRRGGTDGAPSGNVFITMTATNGTAVPGVNYIPLVTNLAFPPGEVLRQVSISVTQDFAITPDFTVDLSLTDPLPQPPSGGPSLGNQPNAQLTIVNIDAALSLSASTYFRNEDAPDGFATIPVLRTGSTSGSASALFFTTTNGTALPGTNYLPVTNIVNFAPGQTSSIVQIPVLHDPTASGNKTVTMRLTNAVGALLLSPFAATLTVVDIERLPGQLMFGQTNYTVTEGSGPLAVTIVRTNGKSDAVSVGFRTVPGTATPGFKYTTTNGVLSFADGETNKTFTVPITDNGIADGNLSFSLVISNATGGASITGPTNVPVTIIDNETGFLFASPAYVIPETGGAVSLTVLRQGQTNSSLSIHYSTTNALVITTNIFGGVTNISTNLGAIAGVNYVPVTNGTLNFTNGESIKSFAIQVLHSTNVTGDLPFNVNLFNPQSPGQLVAPSTATVVVLDSEAGLFFTNSVFGTLKSATNIVVTVVRSNANTGPVTVGFSTSDGTATNGIDYNGVSGILTFSNGIAFQSFSVPLINNKIVQGDRFFNVFLTNATPTNVAAIIEPSIAQVWITNDVSGISYSAGFYNINENGVSAPITITRSGYLNNNVSVSYNTADGTAVGGANYLPANGAVFFTNGETAKTFSVQVIDDGVVAPDSTVLLSLTAPQGNAVLVSPSAAILNIHEVDGSLVLPAGYTLTSESGPVNSLFDSNETVTVLFALRNASGNNTTNLTATLLATNGVSNVSGSQNYGALLSHGPSAFRPFSFKVSGTNGQPIIATLSLHDGPTTLSNAVFNFTIGNVPKAFSNNLPIIIADFTNAVPYPSVINVSGLDGSVTKATVTLSNLYHTWPADIDMLLVSPGGQKTLLMAKCGGGNVISRVNLTFDDQAASNLTGSTIVSGTNKPTSLAPSTPAFLVPAPPGPYTTNLSTFNGSNPNGDWSLYVIDDSHLNTGIVSNGWTLKINTAAAAPADLGFAMTASAPSVITGSNITFNITVTNYGPSTASNVVVLDTLPVGAVIVSASAGFSTNTPGLITWSLPTMVTNSWTNLSMTMTIGVAGPATNTVAFTAGTSDPNPDDDTAAVVVTVASPTADLVLTMSGTPNPVLMGNFVTYTLTVSNLGPATATVVGLTNTLSPGVAFSSATPAGYTRSGSLVTFTNLGTLATGGKTNVSIVVRTLASGTITNNAQAAASITDPSKANNLASVKTIVEQMTIARSGNNIVISWPTDVGTYTLESANSLTPPITWTTVTSPPVQTVGGMNTVTIPIGSGSRYFRLRAGP